MMNNSDSSSGRNTSSGGSSRGSVCSKRKLPGETPVRELDPTLKMIIIKELSAEKVDGNYPYCYYFEYIFTLNKCQEVEKFLLFFFLKIFKNLRL